MNYVTIPERTWKKIESFIKEIQEKDEWVSEQEACKLLNITRATLGNKMRNKEIPASAISNGIGSNKFFKKSVLMGLDNPSY